VELRIRLWHEGAMARRNHLAGGFFLILAIFGGFIWGAMSGLPVHGAIIGTLIGIVLAVAVWLFDLRRG
jgi:hypothetical protein